MLARSSMWEVDVVLFELNLSLIFATLRPMESRKSQSLINVCIFLIFGHMVRREIFQNGVSRHVTIFELYHHTCKHKLLTQYYSIVVANYKGKH